MSFFSISHLGSSSVTLLTQTNVPSACVSMRPIQKPSSHEFLFPISWRYLLLTNFCDGTQTDILEEILQTISTDVILTQLFLFSVFTLLSCFMFPLTCSSELSITIRSAPRLMQSVLLSCQLFFSTGDSV